MRLISQTTAAEIKGVSRQAINQLSRNKWGFFTLTLGGDEMINADHPNWAAYLEGKQPGSVSKSKAKKQFIPDLKPMSLKDLKRFVQVQLMQIEMHAQTGNLLPREEVAHHVQELGRHIQQFVDLGRRVSGRICQKLERTGMEREVEKIVNEEMRRTIQEFKKASMRNIKLKKEGAAS